MESFIICNVGHTIIPNNGSNIAAIISIDSMNPKYIPVIFSICCIPNKSVGVKAFKS